MGIWTCCPSGYPKLVHGCCQLKIDPVYFEANMLTTAQLNAKKQGEIYPYGMICILVFDSDICSHLCTYFYVYYVCKTPNLALFRCPFVCNSSRSFVFPWQRQGVIDDTSTLLISIQAAPHLAMLLYDILISWFAYLCRQAMHRSWALGNMRICVLCSMKDIQYLPLLWKSLINCAHRTFFEWWGRILYSPARN